MPTANCQPVLQHLNRIQGQIQALKRSIESGKDCQSVARLTNSIFKSFASVRSKVIQGYLVSNVLKNKSLTNRQLKEIEELVGLYK